MFSNIYFMQIHKDEKQIAQLLKWVRSQFNNSSNEICRREKRIGQLNSNRNSIKRFYKHKSIFFFNKACAVAKKSKLGLQLLYFHIFERYQFSQRERYVNLSFAYYTFLEVVSLHLQKAFSVTAYKTPAIDKSNLIRNSQQFRSTIPNLKL